MWGGGSRFGGYPASDLGWGVLCSGRPPQTLEQRGLAGILLWR